MYLINFMQMLMHYILVLLNDISLSIICIFVYDSLRSISGFVISSLRAPPSGTKTSFTVASGTGKEASVVLSADSFLMMRDCLFSV